MTSLSLARYLFACGLLAACSRSNEPASILLTDLDKQWTSQVAVPDATVTTFEAIEHASNQNIGSVSMRTPEGGLDVRTAVVLQSGAEEILKVQIPDDPYSRLKFALGWVLDLRESQAKQRARLKNGEPIPPVSYRLTLRESGQQYPLLEETREGIYHGTWQDTTVDLSRWRGEQVELMFSSTAEGSTYSAWANPEIVASTTSEKPNLILISLDTLRADRLGVYGYDQATSPNLDRFAESAHVFSDVTAQSTWTRPSHWSMLSGLYPESYAGFKHQPLAQQFLDTGYRTEAWTAGVQLHPKFGFHQGFESFQVRDWVRQPQDLLDQLSEMRGRPLFLFLHSYETHDPYDHPELVRGPAPAADSRVTDRFGHHLHRRLGVMSKEEHRRVSQLYDADIRFLDQQVGVVLDGFRELGLLDNSIIVVTSDHGEEFWEHSIWFHGKSFYRAVTTVPLMVHFPPSMINRAEIKQPSAMVSTPVRIVDLYPTLLDLFDIPLQHKIQGRSLLPLLRGNVMPKVPIYSEGLFHTPDHGRAIRDGKYKLTWRYDPEQPETEPQIQLFDLEADPMEMRNIAEDIPDVADRLLQLMETIAAGRVESDSTADENLDPEHQAELRALGYL